MLTGKSARDGGGGKGGSRWVGRSALGSCGEVTL